MNNRELYKTIQKVFKKNKLKASSGYNDVDIRMLRTNNYTRDENGNFNREIWSYCKKQEYKNIIERVLFDLKKEYNIDGKIEEDNITGNLDITFYYHTFECDSEKEKYEQYLESERIKTQNRVDEYKNKELIDNKNLDFLLRNDLIINQFVYRYYGTKNHIKELLVKPEFIDAFFNESCYKNTYQILKQSEVESEEGELLIDLHIVNKDEVELIKEKEKEKAIKQILKQRKRKESLINQIKRKQEEIKQIESLILNLEKKGETYETN